MKKQLLTILFTINLLTVYATDYYISPDGNDTAAGTISSPFRTLAPAQKLVKAGDTVYFREGTYKPTVDESMGTQASIYSCAYLLNKSGQQGKPITYMAYPGEKAVFDMSDYKPEGMRVSAFYVSGSWLHIKDLEVIGTQVTITDGTNTQSEVFSNRGGSNNIYENLKMHDGMGIGFYLVKGGNNLVLNCDAWNNYDEKNGGGNTDGFGCHPSAGDTGNVLRGCRAWWNSDDGFDLIHSAEAVRIENCWAFYNGYKPGEFKSAADGNGIKAGGYGMNQDSKIADVIPTHEVVNCLAYYNKSAGIYSNHHLGGLNFINNTAIYNRWNYNMVNRKSADEPVDVNGYGHFLANNVAYNGRDRDLYQCDQTLSTLINNTFGPTEYTLSDADFISLNANELIAERNADGSLPKINFGVLSNTSPLYTLSMGYTFPAPSKDEILDSVAKESQWLMAPTIVIEGEDIWVDGPDADKLNSVYANDTKLKVSKGKASLAGISGSIITIKATLTNGVILTRKIKR